MEKIFNLVCKTLKNIQKQFIEFFFQNSSPLNSSLHIGNMNGLDYGSGMAYSYYHGYLKLIMHDTGTEDKNLKELMEIYEDEHGVKFEAYKLFILIPFSLKCWVSLKNYFSPSVDESHVSRIFSNLFWRNLKMSSLWQN